MIEALGYGSALVGGALLVLLVLLGLSWLSALMGRQVFKRLRRIYHLTVIGYWLNRFEKEGLRTFQRPD